MSALMLAMSEMGKRGSETTVRRPQELEWTSRLTLSEGRALPSPSILTSPGLVWERAAEGMPIMGTCAGCIPMAREGGDEAGRTNARPLDPTDKAVDRNAFGRQRESFEPPLEMKGLGRSFPGMLRRGLATGGARGRCKPLEHWWAGPS